MEMDEAFNPVELGLLGARAVGFDAGEVADAFEQKHRRNAPHQTRLFGPRIADHSHDFLGLCSDLPSVVWPIGAEYSGEGGSCFPGAFTPHIPLGITGAALY